MSETAQYHVYMWLAVVMLFVFAAPTYSFFISGRNTVEQSIASFDDYVLAREELGETIKEFRSRQ